MERIGYQKRALISQSRTFGSTAKSVAPRFLYLSARDKVGADGGLPTRRDVSKRSGLPVGHGLPGKESSTYKERQAS